MGIASGMYNFVCFALRMVSTSLELTYFICNCASALIPWILIGFLLLCIISRFYRLPGPCQAVVNKHLHRDEAQCQRYPVANQAGQFDAPENSTEAIKMCLKRNCRLILLSLELLDDELVILNKFTLQKINNRDPLEKMSFKELENFNISEHHPLGKNFTPTKIMTLPSLISEVAGQDLSVFLSCPGRVHGKHKERFVQLVAKNLQVFKDRFVIVSPNPIFLYQLRKQFPDLVCGLWLDPGQGLSIKYLKSLAILDSIKGAFLRNIIAPVIGFKLVFIHKCEFNEQISDLWKAWGIRPVVYPVNSVSEKRYFQRAIKTQYLTDTLRTEPDSIKLTKS